MSADLDLSPPEVPEPTFLESVLRYGLFLGAIFQLICILAIIFPTPKGHEHVCVKSKSPKSPECKIYIFKNRYIYNYYQIKENQHLPHASLT